MRILIVSDSHGRNTYLKQAISEAGEIDLLIHLGDLEGTQYFLREQVSCKVEMVSGNNDYFTEMSREKIICIGPYRVMLTHGHRYEVWRGTERLKESGRNHQVAMVMFGHTHIPMIDESSDVMVINPGSISQPRQEGRCPSYILMETGSDGGYHFEIKYIEK